MLRSLLGMARNAAMTSAMCNACTRRAIAFQAQIRGAEHATRRLNIRTRRRSTCRLQSRMRRLDIPTHHHSTFRHRRHQIRRLQVDSELHLFHKKQDEYPSIWKGPNVPCSQVDPYNLVAIYFDSACSVFTHSWSIWCWSFCSTKAARISTHCPTHSGIANAAVVRAILNRPRA